MLALPEGDLGSRYKSQLQEYYNQMKQVIEHVLCNVS